MPYGLSGAYVDVALMMADTDWHLRRRCAFAGSLAATLLCERIYRYVIDLNRLADDASLYPGQTTTSLCPARTLLGAAV